MRFTIHQASQIGGRKYNQDRVAYAHTDEALLLVLADGMGGHSHGELAAEMAVDTILQVFSETAQPRVKDPEGFLRGAILRGHQAILHYAQQHQLIGNPGTTVVAALAQDGRVSWAHVGDSRFYLIRDKAVLQVTHDHSLVQQWADWGLITQAQTRTHPDRNRITNCLGGEEGIFFEAVPFSVPLQMGDTVLLCSDGLWGPLEADEIATALSGASLPNALETLMQLALAREQMRADNTTAIAAHFDAQAEEHSGVVVRRLDRYV